ncbi:Flavinator of succinate dehydrogenase-domain-containing protein [Coniochaeta sp. 2T2.1]|nr:Flavinator of succinate dehydrogenase-domain-containing protein [Coniochaeta sp. 2T2.1]
MASLNSLRPTARLFRPTLSRPMATASRHVSLSGYIFPRSSSSSSSSSNHPSNPSHSTPSNPGKPLEVGELEGATFRISPLRRSGEDVPTMRARLLYQSRKRGTLESDLLLSTFASQHLESMSRAQLEAYDKFLDENDWDIYYWATQEPEPVVEGEGASHEATPGVHAEAVEADKVKVVPGTNMPAAPGKGEWAQTVGTFKPAYRPVPARWEGSEVLGMLRTHVKERGMGKGGMAFMPRLK